MTRPYYDHAGITIYHGDALDILPELSGVGALITDPPYSSGGAFRGDRTQKTLTKYVSTDSSGQRFLSDFTGDNRDQRSFLAWCSLWLCAARHAAAPVAAPRALAPRPARVSAPAVRAEGITGPEQKILDELAGLEALGIPTPDKAQVSALCGYTNPRSGGFSGPLGRMSAAGLIRYPGPGTIALTDAGRAAAHAPDVPLTTEALQARVLDKFDGPPARILRELIAAYPSPVDKAALSESLGYSNPRSGGFSGPLGTLSRLGFVTYPAPGQVAASGLLFIEGAA